VSFAPLRLLLQFALRLLILRTIEGHRRALDPLPQHRNRRIPLRLAGRGFVQLTDELLLGQRPPHRLVRYRRLATSAPHALLQIRLLHQQKHVLVLGSLVAAASPKECQSLANSTPMSRDDFVHGEPRAEAAHGRERSAGLDMQPPAARSRGVLYSGEMKPRITPNRRIGLGQGIFNSPGPQQGDAQCPPQ